MAEQYCHQVPTLTYGSRDLDGTITQGGFATHIVVVEDFVVRIPRASRLPMQWARR
jgi:alcohol dehydrogenase (NADP+)